MNVSQIAVDESRCSKDGACVAVCPSRTLRINENGFPEDDMGDRCILCGHCVAVCACNALTHTGLPEEGCLPIHKEPPTPELMDGFLMSRRSTRAFKDRAVSRETLETLLDVARRAPTASNSQKLHWIVAQGADKVHALAAETVHYLRISNFDSARLEQWENGYDFILRGAPVVVVACAPTEYGWGKQDCAIALTYLELAAETRGLGICWAGYLTRVAAIYAPLREVLAVPEGYTVHGGLMIGERKYTYRRIPPRNPLSVQWI